jgi:hypothetical protein
MQFTILSQNHVVNERGDLHFFGYLLSMKQTCHVSHEWLKLDINRTVLLWLLHQIFGCSMYRDEVNDIRS